MKRLRRYALMGFGAGIVLALGLARVFTAEPTEGVVHVATVTPVPLPGPLDPQDVEKRSPSNPDAAAQLRFIQTRDPATNTIPIERLIAANRAAEQYAGDEGLFTTIAERGPSTNGGRTRAVLWDPDVANKVWAGGVSGGLWYTSNVTVDGTSWIKVNDFWDNLAITTMASDPTTSGGSRVFYVGTGEGFFNFDAVRGAGIFKSTDGGSTFNLLSSTENNSSFHYVQKIVVTSTGVVLAATRDGVQRSTNGGTSWTKVLGAGVGGGTVNNAADLEIAANGDVYAALGLVFGGCDGVYKSTNNGVSWTKQTLPGACNYGRIELATAPSDANTVYAATQSASTFGVNNIFKTTNGGTSWASPGAAPSAGTQAWYDLILSVDPNDANRVYLGVVTLWRTTNGGTNWSQITGTGIHVDHHAVVYKPGSSTEAVFGNDGGVYYTANATSAAAAKNTLVPTMVNRNDDYNVTQYYGGDLHPTSTNVMLAGSQDNSTQRFSNPGIGPVTSPSPLNCCDGGFAYFDQTNGNIAVGSIQNGAYYRSTNAGVSFSGPFLSGGSPLFINPGDYDDARNAFYATRSTTQLAACFTMETSPTCLLLSGFTQSDHASTFKVSPYAPANHSIVYFGTQVGELFRMDVTLDGSGNFVSASFCEYPTGSMPTVNVSSIDIGTSESQLLVTFSNFGVDSVWESLNATSNCTGTTWTDRDDNTTLPDIPVNWGLYDPNDTKRVLLATDAGIWGTTDITAAAAPKNTAGLALPTWSPGPTIPLVRVDQLVRRASDGLVMVVTHGRGVWTGQFGDLLPVELVAFDALADGRDVILQWQTASETNNAGFEIQGMTENEGAEWAVLGWVAGQGTTLEPQRYAYRVEDLPPGPHRFRLKQIDYDGTFEHSPEVEVFIEIPGAYVLSDAFPNPFNPQTQFTLLLAAPQKVKIEVFDVAGRRVALLHEGLLEADRSHRFTFDARGLSSGLYFYRIAAERFTAAKTMTLAK